MESYEIIVLKGLYTLGYEGLCRDRKGRLNVYKHNKKGVYIQEFLTDCDNLFPMVKHNVTIKELIDGTR